MNETLRLNSILRRTTQNILSGAAFARRCVLTVAVYKQLHGKVQSGPFVNMHLLDSSSWGDGDLLPKLLGSYELELHEDIEGFLKQDYKTFINIGCAEGYYCVGFALKSPGSKCFGFDTNPEAQNHCKAAAKRNKVHHRVFVQGNCTPTILKRLIKRNAKTLLFLDCEGAELELLDPKKCKQLLKCDFIVECHDFLNEKITPSLMKRFQKSHHIVKLEEGSRNPNQYSLLRKLPGLDRWLAVNEDRPETMSWLVCRSKY